MPNATTVVEFATSAPGVPYIKWELIDGPGVRARLFPKPQSGLVAGFDGGRMVVRTTNGAINVTGQSTYKTHVEYASFSNSTIARLNYPATGIDTILDDSAIFDADGNPVDASFMVNDNFELEANKNVSGVVKLRYFTSFYIYTWTYGTSTDWQELFMAQLMAFYRGATATVAIPFDQADESIERWQLYEVVSEYVVDGDGAWEKPPGFPDTLTYPDQPATTHPTARAATFEQAWELGWFKPDSENWPEKAMGKRFQPYIPAGNYTGYHPQYIFRWTYSGEEQTKAALEIDLAAIWARIQVAYPGVTM